MCRVCLCSCLHIVSLKVIDIHALVVEHAIESVNCELLVDAVDSGFNVFLALVEVVPVYGTERGLVKVGAGGKAKGKYYRKQCRQMTFYIF